MFVVSLSAFILLKKLTNGSPRADAEEAESHPVIDPNEDTEEEGLSPENYVILRKLGLY